MDSALAMEPTWSIEKLFLGPPTSLVYAIELHQSEINGDPFSRESSCICTLGLALMSIVFQYLVSFIP